MLPIPSLPPPQPCASSRPPSRVRRPAPAPHGLADVLRQHKDMKLGMLVVALLTGSITAWADNTYFSTHLYAKFRVKGCTNCHDFFEKKLGGLSYKSHKGRTPDRCVNCHTKDVTGFTHADDWFARPDLYTSGMNSQRTCEATKTALHAQFKNETLAARDLEKHLFEDPRVLWGIEQATPNSGRLPEEKKEVDLVKGGLPEWKEQVRAWIQAGMKCN